MIKFNKKTTYFKVLRLIFKYKKSCVVYLAIISVLYPIFFFLTDYKNKNYNFSINYTNLLLSLDEPKSDEPVLNLLNIDKKINNQIENKLKMLDDDILFSCKMIEYKSNCVLNVKDWTPKKNKLVQNAVINSYNTVINNLKENLAYRINSQNIALKNSSNNEKLMEKYRSLLDKDTIDIDLIQKDLEMSLKVSQFNRLKEESLFLSMQSMKNLNDFQKSLVEDISNYFNNIKFSSFENYSLKRHILSIIIGSGLLFFGLLTLLI